MAAAAWTTAVSCSRAEAPAPARSFASAEEAVVALNAAVAKGDAKAVADFFGPDGRELIDGSDPVTARRNLEIYKVAVAERWRLVKEGAGTTLVIGNEGWPFPVPLVQDAAGWHFDAAAGREEVIARRIGRNELAVIQICRSYVAAQRRYARSGHDGAPAGLYARTFASAPGKQNGLYWAVAAGQPRSPLGDLMTAAAEDELSQRKPGEAPSPFHGYYFRILTAQGAAAAGGARDYVVGGRLSGGFALVAWPARYDETGIMTFIVNQDGIIHEKDLGPDTDATARKMTVYDPDASWAPVQ
jgi:hypothetical protein